MDDIHAARTIFGAEPISVLAESVRGNKAPYQEIEESMSVTLKFPEERLASLIYSFGSGGYPHYRGDL